MKILRFRLACMVSRQQIGLWVVVLFGFAPGLVTAMFAKMSDEELIRRSDLIVIGEWLGQSSLRIGSDSAPMEIGAIAISEVLKGSPGRTLALLAITPAGAPRLGDAISYRRGDKGMWLLRHQPEAGTKGLYLADHPQRFIPDIGGAERIREIRRTLTKPSP